MLQSTRRKWYMVLATSFFGTIGMLAYSSENGSHRRSIYNDCPGFRYFEHGGTTNHQNHVLTGNSSIDGLSKTEHDSKGTVSSAMEERRHRVKSVCSEKSVAVLQPSVKDVLYNAVHKLYYCPVEKVASTFWRRFVYQLKHTSPVKSPFDVSIPTAFRGMRDLHLPPASRSGVGLDNVLRETTKLMFVRDPHSRIFSAYVDKLLAPNPYFWKVWALPAIMRHRKDHHHPRGRSHCGHDATFEEFVKYVINNASKVDGHVMPINKMCTPCTVPYDVIGKMETFTDDIQILFDSLHLNTTPLRMPTMKQETTLDAIADSATDALSGAWLTSSLRCISKEAVLQRIWRKNQIRGFVSWRKSMKLTSKEIQNMKSREFIKLLNEASQSSTDKAELKIQKLQAMKDAFVTLDTNLVSGIAKVYRDDLKLFGYPEIPSWLEGTRSGGFIDTKAFDYSVDWDLSKVIDMET